MKGYDVKFHHLLMEYVRRLCTNKINGNEILQVGGYLKFTDVESNVFCFLIQEVIPSGGNEQMGTGLCCIFQYLWW